MSVYKVVSAYVTMIIRADSTSEAVDIFRSRSGLTVAAVSARIIA